MASTWVNSHKLFLESDSSNVIKWVRKSNEVSWRKRKEVIQIFQLLAKVKEWEISHPPRSANGEADAFSQRRDNKITRLVIGQQPRSSTKLHRRVTQPRNHRDAGRLDE